jgi:small GTP-binding protein
MKSVGMKNIIIGSAGHIDHGKTALVRALTGIDTDRLKEEKQRGISIDLGFAHLQISQNVRLGFVDVPGHERFIKNMLAGVGGIDLVLFVIAADESIKPQTREHFDICRLLGIRNGIIVLTKSDLVDNDLIELVRLTNLCGDRFWKTRPWSQSAPPREQAWRSCAPKLKRRRRRFPRKTPRNIFDCRSIVLSRCTASER